MDGGIASRFAADKLGAALEAFVEEVGHMGPTAFQDVSVKEAPWFVLTESERAVTIATGPWDRNGPGRDGQTVTLERAGAGWRAAGLGGCTLRPLISPGHSWVEMVLLGELERSSTQLVLGVSELKCSGGRDPRPFLREPRIVEDENSVTISLTAEAQRGGATCPGIMPLPHSVRLKEPLGDRVLLDGSRWPARPVVAPG